MKERPAKLRKHDTADYECIGTYPRSVTLDRLREAVIAAGVPMEQETNGHYEDAFAYEKPGSWPDEKWERFLKALRNWRNYKPEKFGVFATFRDDVDAKP
jgi:hypothetical protein